MRDARPVIVDGFLVDPRYEARKEAASRALAEWSRIDDVEVETYEAAS